MSAIQRRWFSIPRKSLCIVVALALLGLAAHPHSSSAAKRNAELKIAWKCPLTFTAKQARPLTDAAWSPSRWERGKPKRSTIRAYRNRVKCAAGPGHRKATKKRWRKAQRAFFRHRREQLANWCAPTPHPEGEGCWVIPGWCVFRESGKRWSAHNPTSPARGAYQLLGHGEPWPVTTRAQALEHHRIAAGLYAAGGLRPWVAC